MATQCRATNPNNCRIHGNPTISSLQAQADKAAHAGNMTEYTALREQIDAAHDALESQPNALESKTTENPETNTTTAIPTTAKRIMDDETLEAGSNAWYQTITGWQQLTNEDTPAEEQRMMKAGVKQDVKKALARADLHIREGRITPAAIDAVAAVFYDTYFQGKPPRFSDHRTPYFQSIGKAILKATR